MTAKLTAAFAVLALAASAAGAATASRPALRLLTMSPLKVSGTHFKARERVRLTVDMGTGTARRSVRTSAAGSFSVGFPDLSYDPCSSGLSVIAIGANGDRAVVKLPPRECPPA